MTANNSTTNDTGCLNIHETYVTANPTNNDIGCLNIHGTPVTANNSTTNKIVLFFVLDMKIVYYNNYNNYYFDHNALDKRGKRFCITIYLDTKSFKTVLKQM